MIVCVKSEGLGLFTTTADQRYMLGDASFIRTHFPVNMRRFKSNGEAGIWSEEDLKQALMESGKQGIKGNRTYVLYGAAGSGKSELIRWLWREMRVNQRGEYVLRISRTELDPVQIIHKILTQFKLPGIDTNILAQWEEMKQKPVTLANHLVWSALGKVLPSDEAIIPLSYKLRPLIEKNLRLNLPDISDSKDGEYRSLELVSREELEDLVRQCFLPPEVDMEQVRSLMLHELENSVMGGVNFVDTLRIISARVESTSGMRPLLLIDDLVQSLNIYASDLLDYFTTMEEGNWDIVLGLTPASFESTKRGRELLNRINHQDTFDDRLIKLWMSDEQGYDSFVVNKENCHLFAKKYLLEFKRLNGFHCDSSCAFYEQCCSLKLPESMPDLLPFTPPLLRRVFNTLPQGKGKPRYFIREIGEMLSKMADNDWRDALGQSSLCEVAADHPDPVIRMVMESYAPDNARSIGKVVLHTKDFKYLTDIELSSEETIEAAVTDLYSYKVSANTPSGENPIGEVDPGKNAIRDWLNGELVNKELLKGFRLGLGHLIREVTRVNDVIPEFNSRQSSTIRAEKTVEGSKIPLTLEGVDDFPGIYVGRNIGHVAYQFNYLHLRRGKAKEEAIAQALEQEEVYHLLMEAGRFKVDLRKRLEQQVGMPVNELAFHLFRLLLQLGQGREEVPVILEEYLAPDVEYPPEISSARVLLEEVEVELIRSLFKDWFLLRENIYDGLSLVELQKRFKRVDSLEVIENIDSKCIEEQFQVGNLPLARRIERIQEKIAEMKEVWQGEETQAVIKEFDNLVALLNEIQHPVIHSEMSSKLACISSCLRVEGIVIPDWQKCNRLLTLVRKTFKGYPGKGRKNSADTHRFLLLLGTLESNENYQQMKTVTIFINQAQAMLARQYQEIKIQAETLGLSGYFKWESISNLYSLTTINYEYLDYLLDSAQNLLRTKNRLKVLEITLPYIDQNLAKETRKVASILLPLEELDLPKWFISETRIIREQCQAYYLTVEQMSDSILDPESNHYLIVQLTSSYQELDNNGLQDKVKVLCASWRQYLVKLGRTFELLGLETDIKVAHEYMHGTYWNQAINMVEQAQWISGYLSNYNSKLITNEKLQPYLSLLNTLLQNQPPEMDVDLDTLTRLSDFIKEYQGFNHYLREKVYLK